MKKQLLFLITLLITGLTLLGQTSITLTFTGRDQNNAHVRLDNVTIQNLTREWTESIFFPDTVYTLMVGTGIDDYAKGNEMQVMPNPFDGKTQLNLYSVKEEPAKMVIVDITGKECAEYQGNLSQGDNYFEILLTTPQTYILSVQTADGVHSVKMVNTGRAGANQIALVGRESNVAKVKISSSKSHDFELGDEMRYTGYSQQSNGLIPSTPVAQQQYESGVITLSFELANDAELPIVATVAASNIGTNTATTGGNVFSDGGTTVTARGVCYSVAPNPTLAESHTTDGTGTGAFTSSLTNLMENTTYYVRAYATNSAGTAYGNEVSFATTNGGTSQDGQPCPGAVTVTDIDNNTYNTVQIGNQCWMKENLRTTRYSNGTSIALGSSTSTTTAYRYYSESVSTYGYLYNWKAVMGSSPSSSTNPSGVQGICPTGWHVPSDAEWTQLTEYVSSQSLYVCGSSTNNIAKALASTTGWNSSTDNCAVGNNLSANNATGLYLLPAGLYDGSYYVDFGTRAYIWSATEDDFENAYDRNLYYNNAGVYRWANNFKYYGLSVRCVCDNSSDDTACLPTVTTNTISSITTTSATCGGNVTSGGGTAVTSRGLCWSTLQNPTVSNSHTTNGSGTGSFTSSLTNLVENTTYYVRAYATNSAGTAYGQEVSFTTETGSSTGQSCLGTPTVTDYEGNIYYTVQIGNQCWMRENLRTTHYSNGTSIALGSTFSSTDSYCYYPNNDQSNVSTYGYLYNWKAAMGDLSSSSANPSGVQGICPTGWHVPSDAEWTQLTDYVKSQNQYVCGSSTNNIAKALASTTGWSSSTDNCAVGNDPSANNATGFSALPAGFYRGYYDDFGQIAEFWSATDDGDWAYSRILFINVAYVSWNNFLKDRGLSVRCVRDNSGGGTAFLPTVTTNTVSSITTTSATCGGNVISDGGTTVTARGVCWSTSQNPTVSNSHTTNGSGTGSFISSLTGLTANTTYYVRAYATNSAGTAYGNEVSFTTTNGGTSQDGQPCPGAVTVTDIDNNTYNTVQIGNQCWMKENLRTTHYSNGTSIALGSSTSTTTAYRYYPNNDQSNVSTYGYLYNWKAVMGGSSSSSVNPSGVQGICPTGWHVPSDAEWTQLTNYVSSQSQYVCGSSTDNIAKALASITGWEESNETCTVGNSPSANNATGFSALPAGIYFIAYGVFGQTAYFWSATEDDGNLAYFRGLSYIFTYVSRNYLNKDVGFSVRCVRDNSGGGTAFLPTVITNTVSSITTTSATCGGNVTSEGGTTVTVRGVCWSTLQNPTVSNSHTSNGSGTGIFTSSLTGLTANTTYYVRAYATNSAGTAYGNEVSFTTTNGGTSQDGQPCPGAVTVTDIDNNTYNTVQIGNQCWMKENLRTTHYSNGTSIALGSSTSTTTAYRYYPNNDQSNVSTYGYLYNWKAVMGSSSSSSVNPSGVQGICPTGWHVPSDAEWTQLTDYVSSQSQYVCGSVTDNIAKALASTMGWNSYTGLCAVGNNPSANNTTGFSILPAGTYYGYGNYDYFGSYAHIWSATEDDGDDAYFLHLGYNDSDVGRGDSPNYFGFSVRCVRD